MNLNLEGKRALVTGGSRGIGAAIALAFAEAGADVAVSARTAADVEGVAGKIRALGRKSEGIVCDVTQVDQVDACVQQTVAALGGLDILVNNAGGSRFMAPVATMRRDGWEKGIALNLTSVFDFCKAAAPHLMSSRGNVVNIASVAGLDATPLLSFYGASKAGVISLTRTLAVEWGEVGVRVNAIAPGWIRTDLNQKLWEDPATAESMIRNVPLKRFGEVEDITGAALFLASDAARYVTGETIVIDGGMTHGATMSV